MRTAALGLELGFQAPSIESFFFFLLFFFGPAAYLCMRAAVCKEREQRKQRSERSGKSACVLVCVSLCECSYVCVPRVALRFVRVHIRVCVLLGTLFRLRRIVAIWMDSYASTQFMHFVNPMVPVGDGKSDSTDQTMSLNMDHWRARSMHENKRPYHSRSRRYALNLSGVLFGRWYTHAVQKKTKQNKNKMVNTSR